MTYVMFAGHHGTGDSGLVFLDDDTSLRINRHSYLKKRALARLIESRQHSVPLVVLSACLASSPIVRSSPGEGKSFLLGSTITSERLRLIAATHPSTDHLSVLARIARPPDYKWDERAGLIYPWVVDPWDPSFLRWWEERLVGPTASPPQPEPPAPKPNTVTEEQIVKEIRVGRSVYRLRKPTAWTFHPGRDGDPGRFEVAGFELVGAGQGKSVRAARVRWESLVHAKFQELYAVDEEDMRWGS
jgi:hypothetical protein